MAFIPVFPPTAKRPASEAVRSYHHKLHAIFSPGFQNVVRNQLSIVDWLLVGGLFQTLVIAISPFPVIWSLAPAILFGLYKVLRTLAIIFRIVENPHMKGVRVGRHTAVFPNADGSFAREPGQSIGGSGMCIILLTSKCNHPLGLLYPPFATLNRLGKAMFTDLSQNADEYGFLGYTSFSNQSSMTKNANTQIMYFKSLEHMYKWVHTSKSHRAGFDWWFRELDDLNEITISHEVYTVPESGFENIYDNAAPSGFAATSHLIEANGGVKHEYQCPMIDANRRDLKMSAARMGTLKNFNDKEMFTKKSHTYEGKF